MPRCAIAVEPRRFHEEQNLITKYISARALGTAALFTPSDEVLRRTFMAVLKAVGRHAPKLGD